MSVYYGHLPIKCLVFLYELSTRYEVHVSYKKKKMCSTLEHIQYRNNYTIAPVMSVFVRVISWAKWFYDHISKVRQLCRSKTLTIPYVSKQEITNISNKYFVALTAGGAIIVLKNAQTTLRATCAAAESRRHFLVPPSTSAHNNSGDSRAVAVRKKPKKNSKRFASRPRHSGRDEGALCARLFTAPYRCMDRKRKKGRKKRIF